MSNSPPLLPVPRHPSPLSFSSRSAQGQLSPLASTSSLAINHTPISSSPPSSSALHQQSEAASVPRPLVPAGHVSVQPASPVRPSEHRLPVEPLPDSILLRSTFNALDHSALNLKRLSKSVLTSTRAYLSLLEQVERAEEEVFARLGELARWLESGYGLNGPSIWDDEKGIRKVRREARQREREEMEVMVEHGVKAVKGELKRNGLGGMGAQGRFENNAKQFYQQTSDYLAPNPSNGQAGLSSSSSHAHLASSGSRPATVSSSDLAQSSRVAQFDLTRYSHHSTLLYAVPPTSIACVDLLVGLYSWAGSLLGEVPELRRQSFTRRGTQSDVDLTASRESEGATVTVPLPGRGGPAETALTPTSKSLKVTISTSLAQLASIRAQLLDAWASRNQQTTMLEDAVAEKQTEVEGGTITELPMSPTSPRISDAHTTPISSSGIEHKRPHRRMHKLHRSVGGKLRDLLSSSGSSRDLASSDRSDRPSRASIDISPSSRPASMASSQRPTSGLTSPPTLSESTLQAPIHLPSVPIPERQPSGAMPRPSFQPRHSMHATREPEYVSPFIASQGGNLPSPFECSPDPGAGTTSAARDTGVARLGGVGGLGAGGDEDERREEVGRKKEGVLWGAGVWEGLTKASGKAKWEKFWVVLDRSSIYEYRDNHLGRPESAYEVIDLKFASVREGRGTDRRFVFEVVTPTKGRRLYQATSETEMKQWLYAICNAIESCINGTSSVRTFDTSKLRTASGSLDDHALPTHRLFPVPPRGLGLGTPGGRRSMPPPRSPVDETSDRRQRKTSFKKVLRQSAEIAGDKWNNVMNHRNLSGVDLPRAPFLAQTGRGASKTSTTPSIEEDGHSASTTVPTSLSGTKRSDTSEVTPAWNDEAHDDIEKRVMEMAGLGLGLSPGMNTGTTSSARRAVSDAPTHTTARLEGKHAPADISRTRSADTSGPPTPTKDHGQVDMALLRRIADLPANRLCADCGRSMKSSRWATLSLREVPMVLFLCIRCVGIHRSLGTHISKPRSVDLDIWSPESIISAREWGNQRGNAFWEARKLDTARPTDQDIAEYIRAKYVQGRWLSDEGRRAVGLQPLSPGVPGVGRAS